MHSILSGLIPGRFFVLMVYVYWNMEYLSTAMCQKIGYLSRMCCVGYYHDYLHAENFLYLVKFRFFEVMKGFYLYIFRSEVDAFVQ